MTTHTRSAGIGAATLALVAAQALGCRGTANNTNTNNTIVTTAFATGTDQTVANQSAQFDVSEVAAPAELLGLIRASSLQAVIARAIRLGLLNEATASAMSAGLLQEFVPDSNIVRIIDRNRPIDVALIWADRRPQMVLAFGVGSIGEATRQLGNRYRLNGLGNGVMELVPTASQPNDPQQEDEAAGLRCFLSPTPQPTQARMTCTQGARAALESMTPFMARTLTRRDARQDAVVATVFPAAARVAFGTQVLQGFDEVEAELARPSATSPHASLFAPPEVRAVGERLAHEVVANLRSVWNESQGLDLTISADDNGAHLTGSVDVHNPSGSLVRAMTEAARTAAPFPDSQLQRIPTDGGVTGAMSLNLTSFAPLTRMLDELVVAVARHSAQVSPAQLQQMQALATTVIVNTSSSTVSGMTVDSQRQPVWITVTRCADASGPTALIQAVRSALILIHRPAIVRAVQALQNDSTFRPLSGSVPDLTMVRELPATGLPAGSILLQFPERRPLAVSAPPSAAPNRGRTANSRPNASNPVSVTQLLLVPDGASYTTVSARDARAAWTTALARTGPVMDPAAMGFRPGTIGLSFSLAGLDAMMSAGSQSSTPSAGAALARMPDQGRTPITLRMSTADIDGNTRFQFAVDMQAVTIRSLGGL